MTYRSRPVAMLLVLWIAGCNWCMSGSAQATRETPVAELSQKQVQLAERFAKIEELFLRLADVEAAENPERAALLRRAARKSRESFILDRLNSAAGDLSSEKYQQAIASQKSALGELETLLKLLMSEDRSQRIREQKDRITQMLKDIKRLERSERATSARTENGAKLTEVEKEQKDIELRAKELEAALAEENEGADIFDTDTPDERQNAQSEANDSNAESKQQDSEPSDKQSNESEKDDSQEDEKSQSESSASEQTQSSESQLSEAQQSQQSEAQPSESQQSQQNESQPSESQQSQQSESQQSQQSESQPSESQQSPESESQPKTPEEAAEQAVKKARQNMQRALDNMKKSDRAKAVEEQKKAEDQLRQAIENLERILRQLREEEMLRELARLEARLREMAQMQTEVLDKTRRLAETPQDQRDRQTDIRAGNLGFEQKKIVLEADRAILLLREEGSSVAFPEVMNQVREDMQRTADRLAQSLIDEITQGIQEDILVALEEMIAALQQAQRDLEKQQQQQQQQQGAGGQGEQPLVQPIAELKLLMTMQTRIRSTTERYGKMLPENAEAADEPDLINLIKSLSIRQLKLYQISRDLMLERNQ